MDLTKLWRLLRPLTYLIEVLWSGWWSPQWHHRHHERLDELERKLRYAQTRLDDHLARMERLAAKQLELINYAHKLDKYLKEWDEEYCCTAPKPK